jgi:polysaccharide export outer membrane protein
LQSYVNAGDDIRILKASETFDKSITFIGAITRPGKYQWKPAQKITDILSGINSHLLKSADLQYSIIVREIDEARNIEIIQFSLAEALHNKNSADNVLLLPRDKVLVFSNINKIGDDIFDLDVFAFTKANLEKKEQKKLKEKYKKELFQNKYNIDLLIKENQLLKDKEEDTQKIKHTVIDLLSDDEEVDFTLLDHFSRQRLLLPIIKKLKRQGGSGQAIQLVEVDGAVKFPGIYPLVKYGRIEDLIFAAGGLEESAYLAQAEITRNVVKSTMANKKSIAVNIGSALNGDLEENILLQSKDRLNVHKIPSWSVNHVVELKGEFVFPGKYTIRRGETLSTLIAKAGGFTQYSAPTSAIFTREKLKLIEQKNLIKLADNLRLEIASKSLSSEGYSQSYKEVQMMLSDLTQVTPVGRLVVDLYKVVEKNQYDILLESGDVLYMPSKNNSINVIGQVQAPTSHVYDQNLDGYDYITQSGGSKKRADNSRIYILSANGSTKMLSSSWFSSPNLAPGDTIVVPLNSEYMSSLSLWTSVSTIIYNSAVAIAAISGI